MCWCNVDAYPRATPLDLERTGEGTMKKRILCVFALSMLALAMSHLALPGSGGVAFADEKPYRVVFDLTSRDSLDQKAVMRWIREISTSSPKAEMEVVMYGKGFELVMPDRTTRLADVQEAAKNPNVTFKVCEIALKNNNTVREQLIKEVQTVPDGIHEIVMKQQQGWGYIKVAH
jgi:intracellular sulfur oxidation DsrE/DsrF family protein